MTQEKRIDFTTLDTPWRNNPEFTTNEPIPDLTPKQSTIDFMNDIFAAHNHRMESEALETNANGSQQESSASKDVG